MDPYAMPVFGIGGLWAGQRRARDGLPAPASWWAQDRPSWAVPDSRPRKGRAARPGDHPAAGSTDAGR